MTVAAVWPCSNGVRHIREVTLRYASTARPSTDGLVLRWAIVRMYTEACVQPRRPTQFPTVCVMGMSSGQWALAVLSISC